MSIRYFIKRQSSKLCTNLDQKPVFSILTKIFPHNIYFSHRGDVQEGLLGHPQQKFVLRAQLWVDDPSGAPCQNTLIRNHNKVQERTPSKSVPPQKDTTPRAHHIKESSPSRRYRAQGTPRAEETARANTTPRWSLLRVVSPARGIFWMGSSL